MIWICDYCNVPIQEGQRWTVIVADSEDGGPVEPKAVFHKLCYGRHRQVAGESDKYGKVTASKKKFHEGEPIFIIRATDALGPATVIDYARRAVKAGCDEALVDGAFDHAMKLADWQRDNPEKVKPIPD